MPAANFTYAAQARLKRYLNRPGYIIPSGLGEKHSACSVAAINLAINGELTDSIPDCMSRVIGRWIIEVQDRMPSELRNSERWKTALVYAPGTGRHYEDERTNMLLDWMWRTVLPAGQPVADKHGFGEKWRHMCEQRTKEAANELPRAILEATSGAPTYSHFSPDCAEKVPMLYEVSRYCSSSAYAAAFAAINAGDSKVGFAMSYVLDMSNDPNIWDRFNPIGLLEHLVWYKAIGRVVYVE